MLAFSDHIDTIVGKLANAVSQSLPSDDQIIMDSVREALAVARTIQRELLAQKRAA